MNPMPTPRAGMMDDLDRLFREELDDVRRVAPSRWTAAIAAGGREFSLAATDGWVRLAAPADAPDDGTHGPDEWWTRAVRANALPAPLKFALNAAGDAVLLADVSNGGSDEPADELRWALRAYRRALDPADTPGPGREAPADAAPSSESARRRDAERRRVEEVCGDLGMKATQRPQGDHSVSLRAGGLNVATLVGPVPFWQQGSDRLWRAHAVLRQAQAGPEVRGAWGHLMLTLSDRFRLVRGLGSEQGRLAQAVMEVFFHFDENKVERLVQALEVCSLAARHVLRELEALEDPSLAATYLTVRGRRSCPDRS